MHKDRNKKKKKQRRGDNDLAKSLTEKEAFSPFFIR